MAAHINDEMLNKMDAYWRAANYLAAGQLYLLDNPLLKEPLKPEHIKKKIDREYRQYLYYPVEPVLRQG